MSAGEENFLENFAKDRAQRVGQTGWTATTYPELLFDLDVQLKIVVEATRKAIATCAEVGSEPAVLEDLVHILQMVDKIKGHTSQEHTIQLVQEINLNELMRDRTHN